MTDLDLDAVANRWAGRSDGEAYDVHRLIARVRDLGAEVIRHRVRALTNGAEARLLEVEASLKAERERAETAEAACESLEVTGREYVGKIANLLERAEKAEAAVEQLAGDVRTVSDDYTATVARVRELEAELRRWEELRGFGWPMPELNR